MRLRIQSNKKKGNSQPTTGVTRGQSIAVSVRIREITIRKEGGRGGWGREKSSFIFGRKLVWQVCTVTITFLRVGVDPGNEVGTPWLHLQTGKKPSNPPSQAFTIKALLRFYFLLFVYLFVYCNYFFWWRGGEEELGAFEGHLVTQTNPKMRAVSTLSLDPNQKVN